MENFIKILENNNITMMLLICVVLLFLGFIVMIIKLTNINKKYKTFINKLGNGKNIEEDLENYMYRVERVEKQNAEILNQINITQKNMGNCLQKVGIVRYSAFKDTGSDLSFAVALLDENNDGVVFNGIYSREMSNIYAKPIKKGKSTYTISEEEQEAIEKAMNNIYR